MGNYESIRKHALELQKIMIANPANAGKSIQEITTEAIAASEDIHTVLAGHQQLAEILEASQQAITDRSTPSRGVISWLFRSGLDQPDHLG